MKSNKTYLQHILEMIARIESATSEGKEAFVGSALHQDAVLRNLHTMTETTQRLSTDLKKSNPEIEWATLRQQICICDRFSDLFFPYHSH